jgi:hypothetical protein
MTATATAPKIKPAKAYTTPLSPEFEGVCASREEKLMFTRGSLSKFSETHRIVAMHLDYLRSVIFLVE